jgi:hypothetical protein
MVKLGRIFGVIQDNSLVMVIEQPAKRSVARRLCRRYLYLTEMEKYREDCTGDAYFA